MNKLPIYEQVAENIKSEITKGLLLPGDKLLSVRAMAIRENVNPNTIAKSYQVLEREGVIVSIPNKGSFVNKDVLKLQEVERKDKLRLLSESLDEALRLGIQAEELHELIRKVENDFKA
ncbi:GntR family transcriptional regulator [Streptococcaceae bacterium ESL0687]|nr:GntR family transcriptional regulator [Streptococcaceae bacterium ESL0687]